MRRDGELHVVVVLNLTPILRTDYRLGAPTGGAYVPLLSSDSAAYGGEGHELPERFETEAQPWHGHEQSLSLVLPPLSALVLQPAADDTRPPPGPQPKR